MPPQCQETVSHLFSGLTQSRAVFFVEDLALRAARSIRPVSGFSVDKSWRVKARKLFGVWERIQLGAHYRHIGSLRENVSNTDSDLGPHTFSISGCCAIQSLSVVCVQPNGGLPSHPYLYSMIVIKYLLLRKQGDCLNDPLWVTWPQKHSVMLLAVVSRVAGSGSKGSFRFGAPVPISNSSRGASWVPTPNPLLFL